MIKSQLCCCFFTHTVYDAVDACTQAYGAFMVAMVSVSPLEVLKKNFILSCLNVRSADRNDGTLDTLVAEDGVLSFMNF